MSVSRLKTTSLQPRFICDDTDDCWVSCLERGVETTAPRVQRTRVAERGSEGRSLSPSRVWIFLSSVLVSGRSRYADATGIHLDWPGECVVPTRSRSE